MYINAFKLALALVAFAKLSSATAYAQFCNDYDCKVGCGISVSVDNPGCLNEDFRHSILFHGLASKRVSLVFSPTHNCPCQNYCIENIIEFTDGTCRHLRGTPGAHSFRFIGGGCASNNC